MLAHAGMLTLKTDCPLWRDYCHSLHFPQCPLSADTVEKLQIFRPDKTICVLSFLSNLTHGGDHINRDLFLQSHC